MVASSRATSDAREPPRAFAPPPPPRARDRRLGVVAPAAFSDRPTTMMMRFNVTDDDDDDDDGMDDDIDRRHRRRTLMRAKLATTARGGAADASDVFADGDVADDFARVAKSPAFIVDPRDARGRRIPRDALGRVYRLSHALSRARFDPSSVSVSAHDMKALKGAFHAQFWMIKRAYVDCVVLVKHGSFFNAFDIDADVGHEIGLRQSGGNSGFMRKVGFPCTQFDEWAAKLLALGYSVARVEQMDEDEHASKRSSKVMKRECCEILTPSIERGLTQSEHALYFLAIAEGEDGSIGACAFDAASSTGAIGRVSLEELATVLVTYDPREVVISETLNDDARKVLVTHGRSAASGHADCVLRVLERGGATLPPITRPNVLSAVKHFSGSGMNDKDDDASTVSVPAILCKASDVELQAVAYAMRHLAWVGVCEDVFARVTFTNLVSSAAENNAAETMSNVSPSAFALSRELTFMKLDGDAIKSLHILTGDTGKLAGSLFAFLNQTLTAPGRRRLRQWLVRPLRDVSAINARLDVVQELSRDPFLLQSLRDALKHIKVDYERTFNKAARLAIKAVKTFNIVRFNQTLTPEVDAMGLKNLGPSGAQTLDDILLDAVNMVNFWAMYGNDMLDFTKALDGLIDICDVVHVVAHISEKNVSIADLVRDLQGARDFLRQLRSSLVVTAVTKKKFEVAPSTDVFVEYADAMEEAIRERKQDPLQRMQAERQRKQIKSLHLVLSDDDDDANLPEQDADDRADIAAANAFTEVMHAFAEELPRFERVVSAMCDLDVLQSFATTSASARGSIGFTRPNFSSAPNALELTRSWHPLLRPSIVDKAKRITHNAGIVENNISMEVPFMLLTGPNMSGKSSLLRQIALTVILAQIGCYVPCSMSSISICDAIMTRIGGDDNLANGVSTFLNEMNGTAKILTDFTPSTLVILDELGRGTSTLDGYAIAFAVAHHLTSSSSSARVLFATHYHDLIQDLSACDVAENAPQHSFKAYHIGVESTRGALRFTYKLERGAAPLGSCALNVARLAGFPPGILTRAAHVAHTVNFNRASGAAVDGDNRAISSYVPPEKLLSQREHVALHALCSDAAVCGDAEALGDGAAWARAFYALWLECSTLARKS